jgi:hypothetical protein
MVLSLGWNSNLAAEKVPDSLLLSASHIGVVTVSGVEKSKTGGVYHVEWMPLIKGWIIETRAIKYIGSPFMEADKDYLVFASETNDRKGNLLLYVAKNATRELLPDTRSSLVVEVIDRLDEIERQLNYMQAFHNIESSSDFLVQDMVSQLFKEDSRTTVLYEMYTLPKEYDQSIVKFAYDTRRIPVLEMVVSADLGAMTAPGRLADTVQEVIIWIAQRRSGVAYGNVDDSSAEKKTAIADAVYFETMRRYEPGT